MSTTSVGGGAGPLSLMSCVRESSPQPENEREHEKTTTSKKRFWNPKRWFKRKQQQINDDANVAQMECPKDSVRSRSASELSDVDDDIRRRSTSSMHQMLSLSHDSVFQSPHSGSSEMELDAAQSVSSLSNIIAHHQPYDQKLKTELCEKLRLRRNRGDTTSEDDEGLPRSPCNSPNTTTSSDTHHHHHPHGHKTAKDLPTKSHSTCSDGSLLSMDGSEVDEDSFGQNSRHSSKLSLQEKIDSDFGIDSTTVSAPLNHSAAHHRVAVRPKRTYGVPHRKNRSNLSATALPATPEVNEDSSVRSITPENLNTVSVTELCGLSAQRTTLTETQLKCSSLPPGLAAPSSADGKLNRSKSNAGSKSQDHFSVLTEQKEERSFIQKFMRSSGKKKRSKEKHQEHLSYTSTITTKVETKPVAAPRSTAATRQRVVPKNIPVNTEEEAAKVERSSNPIQLELETRFKQKLASPPLSPKPREEDISKPKEASNVSRLSSRFLSMQQQIDEIDTFKSLTGFETQKSQSIVKSQSFKTNKEETEGKISKAASSDSIKMADFPIKIKAAEPEIDFDSLPSDIIKDVKEITNEMVSEIRDSFASETRESFNHKIYKDKANEIIMHQDKELSSGITISGPSHTAVVNVMSSNADAFRSSETETTDSMETSKVVKEREVSVTRIQVKTTTVKQEGMQDMPEFLSKQLNKVEAKSSTNVIFSMKSPKKLEEERPKSIEQTENAKTVNMDSDVDLDIVEKCPPRFRKNVRSTPETPTKPYSKTLSISLDSLKNDNANVSDKSSSQDSLSDKDKGVVLRHKPVVTKKKEDESELMKVFARRSLKIPYSEMENLKQALENSSKDSDKENSEESPLAERKSIGSKDEEIVVEEEKKKEPLKESEPPENAILESTAEVTFRKSPFKNVQRSVTMQYSNQETKKPLSFKERKTQFWQRTETMQSEEIIVSAARKDDLGDETGARKSFNQLKAAWDKRGQLAQRNASP